MSNDEVLAGEEIGVDNLDAAGWSRRIEGTTVPAFCATIGRIRRLSTLVDAVSAARAAYGADTTEPMREVLAAAARRFPQTGKGWLESDAFDRRKSDLERDLVKVAAGLELAQAEKDGWRALLLADRYEPNSFEDVERLALRVLDVDACKRLLGGLQLAGLGNLATRRRGVLRAVARIASDQLIERIRDRLRGEPPEGQNLWHLSWVLRVTIDVVGSRLVPEVGTVLASEERGELLALVEAHPEPDIAARMKGIAEAHAALHRAATLNVARGDSLVSQGANALLNEVATGQPEDWSEYLRIALWRRTTDQALVQPTISAAKRSPRTVAVLREMVRGETAAEPRDRARALLFLVEGLVAERPSRDALLRLVELLDGPDAFPSPLRLASSTWLGSLELEEMLRGRVNGAVERLARELPERLARNEEKLTTRILASVQRALEDAVIVAAEATDIGKRVAITCEYRELSRDQEKQDGADVAWLLDVDVPEAMRFCQAEFVQAKKAVREEDGTYSQKWTIDTAQLKTLLKRSQTAMYWLYGPDGIIRVVPARLVRAILAGEDRASVDHARIDLAHVRSMSASLAQFLVDLFTGAWLGTGDSAALSVARGEVPGDKPDVLFTLRVRGKRHG